ncbi:MAG TPA: TIGR01777 family oxidoreductase [Acidimicrobiales bacterium]
MKVAVTGSHGLIGSALVASLEADGHEVVRVVRGPGDVLDVGGLGGVEAVVHLAGEGIAERRWTPAQKEKIRHSRIMGTDLLARRLAELTPRPAVLVSGSAVGYYGDRSDTELDESSAAGTGFLADLCREWEAATAPAADAGIRVARIRTGIVQSPNGGALKRQLPLFKFGLGGRLGPGRQYQSWIAIDDEVSAIRHVLNTDDLSGPVNLTAPNAVTNAEFTATLASVLRRPALLPVPRFGLALVLGRELVDEALLFSQRVMPRRLEQSGYQFHYPSLEGALRALLA